MISYEEAFSRVMSEAKVLPAESTPLADACGRVLSEDVAIDMDMPPLTSQPWMVMPAVNGSSGRFGLWK